MVIELDLDYSLYGSVAVVAHFAHVVVILVSDAVALFIVNRIDVVVVVADAAFDVVILAFVVVAIFVVIGIDVDSTAVDLADIRTPIFVGTYFIIKSLLFFIGILCWLFFGEFSTLFRLLFIFPVSLSFRVLLFRLETKSTKDTIEQLLLLMVWIIFMSMSVIGEVFLF